VNSLYLSGSIIEHKFINTVPATLDASGYVISAHCIGVASMFNIISHKRCYKCGEVKLRSEFYKNKSTKDGLQYECKSCDSEKTKSYISRNYEFVASLRKRWREAHPERESARRWDKENQTRKVELNRLWRANNPEKYQAQKRTRRAREQGSDGTITAQEWRDLKKKYNYTCLCCNRREPEIKLTLDHVKPLVLGGINTIDNAQPLCASCNSKKHDKWIDYRKNRGKV
jgi:5-methylcytosine-specific restriction endonuclease McrA